MQSKPSNSNSDKSGSLEISGNAKPSVPVFSCLVYLSKIETETGGSTVIGKVANLAGLQAEGASERFVLSKISRDFKSLVVKLQEEEKAIPWIDPPPPPSANEQVRSIPVHL